MREHGLRRQETKKRSKDRACEHFSLHNFPPKWMANVTLCLQRSVRPSQEQIR
jgi:hypothetical protein